jgi:hypothetical protein
MKTAIKIKLILFITVLWAFSAYSATIGTAVLLKGQMKVESQDTYQLVSELNATIEVNEADKIHTGAGARVKIFLREKKEVVHLYAKSFLTMDKITEEQSDLSLLIGKARFVVEPTVNKLTSVRRKFQVRTSNAFIGVRGTDFVVQTDGISTDVLTVDGVVAVANQADPDVEVEVGKNQASKTSGDAPPTPATDVPEDAVEDITNQDEAEEWEEVPFPEEEEVDAEEGAQPDEETDSLAAAEEAQEQVDEATETAQDTTRSSSVKFTITEE